jgi:Fructose-bisphosphate aldolase class-II
VFVWQSCMSPYLLYNAIPECSYLCCVVFCCVLFYCILFYRTARTSHTYASQDSNIDPILTNAHFCFDLPLTYISRSTRPLSILVDGNCWIYCTRTERTLQYPSSFTSVRLHSFLKCQIIQRTKQPRPFYLLPAYLIFAIFFLLDHADVSDEETVCKILDHKCKVDSVMIDGSSLSLAENTKWTKKMVRHVCK